jgi:hypothetical protein
MRTHALARTKKARKYRRLDGRYQRVKNGSSAGNAKPKVKFLSRDTTHSLLRDPLDMRTQVGKAFRARVQAYIAHMGGADNLTATEARLVELAARRSLRTDCLWATAAREGLGKPTDAGRDFDRAVETESRILLALGLPRRQKELSLSDLLAQQGTGSDEFETK